MQTTTHIYLIQGTIILQLLMTSFLLEVVDPNN